MKPNNHKNRKPRSPQQHAADLRAQRAIKEQIDEERFHGPTGELPLLLGILGLICLIGLITALGISVA